MAFRKMQNYGGREEKDQWFPGMFGGGVMVGRAQRDFLNNENNLCAYYDNGHMSLYICPIECTITKINLKVNHKL